MAEMFCKDDVPWIREDNGVEHEAGDLAEWQEPVEPAPDPLAVLTAKVDLLLTARIKAGEVTADMVQAADMPEAAKTELLDKIVEVVAATVKTE